jgi:hypothetical protein
MDFEQAYKEFMLYFYGKLKDLTRMSGIWTEMVFVMN